MSEFSTPDKIAAYLGGGLVLLGVVGIGLLEIVAGSPHPVTTDGQVEHEALVPLAIRSYVILLGFLTWTAYALYKVLVTTPATDPSKTP